MNARTKDDKIQEWDNLMKAARASESELRGVEPFVEALEDGHDAAVSLRCRRDALLASAMELTAEMNAAFAVSRDAAIALRSYIKGVLGPRSERLKEFGIAPLRGRKGRKR